MVLFIVMTSVIVLGLIAIALGQPPHNETIVWNDDTERRLLRERKITVGWW